MLDITNTTAPKSDQLNAEDLLSGPRTVTVERVTTGTAEQPVEIHLAGLPGRPFKPSKTVRRILLTAWGSDADLWAGRRMTLYRDPSVKFGRDEVGGIRVSHLSHIDKRLTLALTVTRGKRAPFVVEPLPDVPGEIADAEKRIAEAVDLDALKAIAAQLKTMNLGQHKAVLQALWAAREAELKAPRQDSGDDYGDLLDAAADQ